MSEGMLKNLLILYKATDMLTEICGCIQIVVCTLFVYEPCGELHGDRLSTLELKQKKKQKTFSCMSLPLQTNVIVSSGNFLQYCLIVVSTKETLYRMKIQCNY